MIFDDRNAELRYNCIPLARNDVQASIRPSFPPPARADNERERGRPPETMISQGNILIHFVQLDIFRPYWKSEQGTRDELKRKPLI